MTNLKTIFKQKSKLLLIVLSLLGMLFSYSCSCRNNSTAPNTPEDTQTNNIITPSSKLSRQLMVVNSGGTATSKSITITVNNADLDNINFDISSPAGFTKDNFDITDNILTLTGGFGNVDNTEKDVTITLKYNKKADAEKDATLSPSSEEKTFKITKAKVLDINNDIKPSIDGIGEWIMTGVPILKFGGKNTGGTFSVTATAPTTTDDSDYETVTLGKDVFGSDKLLSKLKSAFKSNEFYSDITYLENKTSGDNVVFYYQLSVKDTYEFEEKIGIEIINSKHTTGKNYAIKWTE